MATDDQDSGKGTTTSQGDSVADMLKRSFADYVHEHEVVPTEGEQQLNLDMAFIRDHGGPLVAHMLKNLTRTLLPDNLNFTVPAEQTKAEGDEGGGVAINFDLGDFLGKLLQPPAGDDGHREAGPQDKVEEP